MRGLGLPLVASLALLFATASSAELVKSRFTADVNSAMVQVRTMAEAEASRFRMRPDPKHPNDLWYEICLNSRGEQGLNKIDARDLARHKQGECADLSGQDLRGLDLSGASLRGAYLFDANLAGANLKKANLAWVKMYNVSLIGADLESADLSFAYLHGVIMSGANLSWAKLKIAYISKASLLHARLRGADMGSSDISVTILTGADLRGANLSNARIGASNLDEADLQGTNLLGATLNGHRSNEGGREYGPSSLRGAKFKGSWYNDKTKLPFDENEALRLGMIKQ